jgi:peptidyl-prolyl cis-trans isomerase C
MDPRVVNGIPHAVREPQRFAELARDYSNCPSAAQGGALGQLGRGDSVPEFERALFESRALGVLPELVDTRYGFHVVLVARRIAGKAVPFDAARGRIGTILREHSTGRALAQYVQILADESGLKGIDLQDFAGPLAR